MPFFQASDAFVTGFSPLVAPKPKHLDNDFLRRRSRKPISWGKYNNIGHVDYDLRIYYMRDHETNDIYLIEIPNMGICK